MPSIQIFTGSHTPDTTLIMSLARHWKNDGLDVKIASTSSVDADVGIVHIDSTRVAPERLPANPHGRPLLNHRVLDISKRRVSSRLLTADSSYDGKVIVKTDNNFRGIPERMAGKAPKTMQTRAPRFYSAYEIFDRLADVPESVWGDENLVVERFIPEMDNGSYILRSWIFFGDAEYNARMTSPEPIVKHANITSHEFTDDVPDTLREARARMHFDFGKFDYVIVDGEVILFDTNKTPGVAYSATSPRQIRLAKAIYSYLPDSL
jgi:hypothetical protein